MSAGTGARGQLLDGDAEVGAGRWRGRRRATAAHGDVHQGSVGEQITSRSSKAEKFLAEAEMNPIGG